MNIVNQIYLPKSTIGHLMNDPLAEMYEGNGALKLNKNVLLNIKPTGWDDNTKKLLNSAPEMCYLVRDLDKGAGWFKILNL